MSRIRAAVPFLTASLFLSLAATISAPSAHAAGSDCVYVGSQPWSVCINVHSGGLAQGHVLFPIIPEPTDPYTWVEECGATGQNCQAVPGSLTSGRVTPLVGTTSGKTYRGCADFYDGWNYVAGCSPVVPA